MVTGWLASRLLQQAIHYPLKADSLSGGSFEISLRGIEVLPGMPELVSGVCELV